MHRRLATCVLLPREDGKILCVSRKDAPQDFGMPGGKVEEWERLKEAASRELYEETGFIVTFDNLQLVYCDITRNNYKCYTFLATDIADREFDQMNVEDGKVKWLTFDKIEKDSFNRYNRNVYFFVRTLDCIDVDEKDGKKYVRYTL